MLRGAHKAVERARALSFERVWIVAVPVVFALTLDWVARVLLVYHLTTARFPGGATAPLLAAGGPLVLRTAILLVCLGATGYAAVWTFPNLREVFRLGRRAFPGPALSRAFAGAVLLLLRSTATLPPSRRPPPPGSSRGWRRLVGRWEPGSEGSSAAIPTRCSGPISRKR